MSASPLERIAPALAALGGRGRGACRAAGRGGAQQLPSLPRRTYRVLDLRGGLERHVREQHAGEPVAHEGRARVRRLGCAPAYSTCCCIRCSCCACGGRCASAGSDRGARCRCSWLCALGFAVLASPALVLGELLTSAGTASPITPCRRNGSGWCRILLRPGGPDLDRERHDLPVTYGFGLALVTGFAFYQRLRDRSCAPRALERALTRRTWRRCACSSRRTRYSICCTPSAATSTGIRRPRSPWWCSSPICCAAC